MCLTKDLTPNSLRQPLQLFLGSKACCPALPFSSKISFLMVVSSPGSGASVKGKEFSKEKSNHIMYVLPAI